MTNPQEAKLRETLHGFAYMWPSGTPMPGQLAGRAMSDDAGRAAASVARPWQEFRIWLQHLLLGNAIFAPFALLGCWAVGVLARADHIGWACAVAVPAFLWDVAWLFWLADARTWRPADFAIEGWTWADGWADAVCSVFGCRTFVPWLQPWGYTHVCNAWHVRSWQREQARGER